LWDVEDPALYYKGFIKQFVFTSYILWDLWWTKVAPGQIYSDYVGLPCKSFHRMIHIHHHPSFRAAIIGQIVAYVPTGLSLTPPKETQIRRLLKLIQYGARITGFKDGKDLLCDLPGSDTAHFSSGCFKDDDCRRLLGKETSTGLHRVTIHSTSLGSLKIGLALQLRPCNEDIQVLLPHENDSSHIWYSRWLWVYKRKYERDEKGVRDKDWT
jgi:hypothetical protein